MFVEDPQRSKSFYERAFDVPHHRGQRDLLRSLGQTITPGHATPALHHAAGFKVVENLFEKAFGNVLPFGDRLDAHDSLFVIQTQY